MSDSFTPLSATATIEVPFHDVDSMQITWHGHYIKYFEIARCALLDKIDYDYQQMKASGYAWPVVDLRVKYRKPTTFKQLINVSATLVEYENRLKIRYLITDYHSDEKLISGHTIQVAVDIASQSLCFISPAVLIDKIKAQQ